MFSNRRARDGRATGEGTGHYRDRETAAGARRAGWRFGECRSNIAWPGARVEEGVATGGEVADRGRGRIRLAAVSDRRDGVRSGAGRAGVPSRGFSRDPLCDCDSGDWGVDTESIRGVGPTAGAKALIF